VVPPLGGGLREEGQPQGCGSEMEGEGEHPHEPEVVELGWMAEGAVASLKTDVKIKYCNFLL